MSLKGVGAGVIVDHKRMSDDALKSVLSNMTIIYLGLGGGDD